MSHNIPYTIHITLYIPTGLKKQTNPNWRAYLFLTDDRPFGDKLKSIVLDAQDSRVVYYEVESAFRPAVSFAVLFLDMVFCADACLLFFNAFISLETV